jgi:hypothetical protein
MLLEARASRAGGRGRLRGERVVEPVSRTDRTDREGMPMRKEGRWCRAPKASVPARACTEGGGGEGAPAPKAPPSAGPAQRLCACALTAHVRRRPAVEPARRPLDPTDRPDRAEPSQHLPPLPHPSPPPPLSASARARAARAELAPGELPAGVGGPGELILRVAGGERGRGGAGCSI